MKGGNTSGIIFLLFFVLKRVDIQSQHQQPTGTFKAYS